MSDNGAGRRRNNQPWEGDAIETRGGGGREGELVGGGKCGGKGGGEGSGWQGQWQQGW
jgi:hypothetical protein